MLSQLVDMAAQVNWNSSLHLSGSSPINFPQTPVPADVQSPQTSSPRRRPAYPLDVLPYPLHQLCNLEAGHGASL